MDLYKYIFKRKACRDYILKPLSNDTLVDIGNKIDSLELLFEDAPINYRFITKTKGMFRVEAPHYLVFSGSGKDGEHENVGFIGQQLQLWLNSKNIGNVWLGASKDANNHTENDIIIMGFGKSENSIYRDISEFKRKDISEISNIPNDTLIKAAHLAPSGLNLQLWYFEKVDDKIVLYRQILKPPTSLAYKLTKIDLGIALTHFYIAYKHFNKDFKFYNTDINKSKKGYKYFGYIDHNKTF